jgi:8-oxo-dGTP diphosphatase
MKPIEIHVAAAAIVDVSGQVLLAKRPDGAHQGGLWEFPGGKLEPGETVADGLSRELQEELGIAVTAHRPLIRVRHDYPDRSVLLDIHRVTAWQGEPQGREGQPLAWVSPDAIATYPMPPADVPIVAALQLPDEYVITPPDLGERTEFFAALDACLQRGVRLFQLRVFGIPEHEFVEIGREFCRHCHDRDAGVLLNGDHRIATAIGADGLHLTSRILEQQGVPQGYQGLVAASCHSIEQLQRAQSSGADFAMLSPVLPTRSHPDADPLGWATFAAWVDQVSIPVYALGGMQSAHKDTAWQAGAQGVAGIRGLWSA